MNLRTQDIYHQGFVVESLEMAKDEFSQVFDVDWTTTGESTFDVWTSDGARTIDFTFVYSTTGPNRLELIEAIPETLWELPAAGTHGPLATHHFGVWVDDVAAASRMLAAAGSPLLVTADDGSGDPFFFAYHRTGSGALVEIVDRANQPNFQAWWDGAPDPFGDD